MPSPRRLRLLCIVAIAVLFTLLFTSRLRQASDTDANSIQGLYHKTRTAIDRARADGQAALQRSKTGADKGHLALDKDADGDIDQDDEVFAQEMSDRLRAAEQKAKDLANSKSPNKPDAPRNIVGVGSSAGGQTAKKKTTKPALAEVEADEKPMVGTSEDEEVKAELDMILRKSPVVIFSKSYCPYSKRAKGILLEKYRIEPAPYVVELDQHPLGPQIQQKLGDMTKRKTVPNILVNGKSIGGGDEITELDATQKLITTVNLYGDKHIKVKERFPKNEAAA
ncbi:hypothetical protein MCOR25_005773 [Pyricularia grisea]|uniref:Glutaredoxin domain-containing protein n=1 Tax=Pyricularia grisea TaxID=148305 RepID=A0A6P8BD94_PYRGI|nr:uncharacterized protein PgNI_05011 [Pyricularia grisea]KAI6363836.1 hypothetical protein MCOR25_005773 [Pyricularia grisea]TLD13805.1 hypothetical protein PgNI_05011 [Pyricularia grisea]